jgi:serine/threonine-protein kinase HipA
MSSASESQPSRSQPSAKPVSEVAVYVHETPGDPIYVGVLGSSYAGGRNLASSWFQYDSSYLARADRYALSPDLPLTPSRTWTTSNTNLFGAFADASPDAWGQKLVQAHNAAQRRHGFDVPRGLGDFDFLVGVPDNTRMGALRLAPVGSTPTGSTPTSSATGNAGYSWLGPESRPVSEVGNLLRTLQAARRFEEHQASDDDIEYLAGIATSPGGARPKANLWRMGSRLALAKLPHSKDGNVDVEGWEAVALTIARNAGVSTPTFSVERVSPDKAILIVDRFDRHDIFGGTQFAGVRRGYMSAATALGLGKHDDNARITYEQFADTIAETSSAASRDLEEMYARIALTVLVNNVDDHWRNHGFIHHAPSAGPADQASQAGQARQAGGWRLSPVFDVNPSPLHGVIFSRQINDDDDPQNRDIRNLHAIADAYGLTSDRGAEIIARVAAKVRRWPEIARAVGIPENQHEQMSAAFDEEQLALAEKLSGGALPKSAASRGPKNTAESATKSAAERRKRFPELFDDAAHTSVPQSGEAGLER